jgi:hypothetical protein
MRILLGDEWHDFTTKGTKNTKKKRMAAGRTTNG